MLENMKAINLSNIILCEIKELMFCTSSLSNFPQEFKVFFSWSLSDSSEELNFCTCSLSISFDELYVYFYLVFV